MLTTNDSDFNLYMTDVQGDNFAVDTDGRVHLVDVEDVVIVDRQQLEKGQRRAGEEGGRGRVSAAWGRLHRRVG